MITLSEKNDDIVITGNYKVLLTNRRTKLYMMSNLPYKDEGDYLRLTSHYDAKVVSDHLKSIVNIVGEQISYDTAISDDLKAFQESEELFAKFSEEAYQIKQNNCQKEEFQAFADSLAKNMTARRLYPLQMLSAYHLAFSQNGCNFSVPGAGKTSIVYGAYTYLKNLPQDDPKKVDKILIIGPLSAFGPWRQEYEECYGRPAQYKIINGSVSVKEKTEYFYSGGEELTIISYASVVALKEPLAYFLRNNRVMVVLDEAHKIKNTNGGITAGSIMEIAPFCRSRVILTGTPAPNGYEDLYNLFHFIWPKNDVIQYSVNQLQSMSEDEADNRIPKMLHAIDPFYIRIRKSDLGIPPATENDPIIVPMGENQKRIYEFIEQKFVEEAQNSSNLQSIFVKAKMIRLLQAATNPALLRQPLRTFSEECETDLSSISDTDAAIMNDIMRFYNVDEIPEKFNVCIELIKKIIAEGGKVVVWAVFIHNIEYLERCLNQEGISCRKLYGATPVATDGMSPEDEAYEKTREAIIQDFHREDSNFKVIIANPFAVAESISLHKACHNAIYLERTFDCARFLQSKDRIHRYGLKSDVITNYYYILSENSVDLDVATRLKEKEIRMLHVIENMPIPLFTNTTDEGDEDIKAIIASYVKRQSRKI